MERVYGLFAKLGIVLALATVMTALLASGCDQAMSPQSQILEFEKAGDSCFEVDIDNPDRTTSPKGPYRVIPGDTLEFKVPVVLTIVTSDISEWLRPGSWHREMAPYMVRVSQAGTITMPIIDEISVSGKTLAEIEAMVIDAYYPRYVVNSPMVVCKVSKYRNENERIFTVLGLVNKPDSFPYPPDVKYNLMEALAFAGGLDIVADPHYVKVFRQDDKGKVVSAVFGVDSKSLSDAYDVIIRPGDVIYVDQTPRTRFNKFIADIFQVRVGASMYYRD